MAKTRMKSIASSASSALSSVGSITGSSRMDDVGTPRRTNRRSRVETERDAGLEVAAEWAKEDDKYRALLRIAKAVEEARRESDMQTLQHLAQLFTSGTTRWSRGRSA